MGGGYFDTIVSCVGYVIFKKHSFYEKPKLFKEISFVKNYPPTVIKNPFFVPISGSLVKKNI